MNDFVLKAFFENKIEVLSNGSPWRPLIDVKDMARAIEWALVRDNINEYFDSVNIGSNDRNYQVKDLVIAVKKFFPNADVSINELAPEDKRSYQVDFTKFKKLAPNHQPLMTLDDSIKLIKDQIELNNRLNSKQNLDKFIRLKTLEKLQICKMINMDMRWNRDA